ncbi:pentatricopeptide repeat-containing protein At1g11290, chloroplastic-like isoform X1 [Lycium barbarum]|uniref:pentatricopeptide repeat-containing protein At1g11290, chloroplastic-like isoform X1 n=1 Tax=Lycium barbarum TaxID=112863 RepID=UPI00293E0DF0|nr:pentatricopeptide repeat-containing protein At1g11290, chloroplastic-like isoform X1 [Lycium barbarum]
MIRFSTLASNYTWWQNGTHLNLKPNFNATEPWHASILQKLKQPKPIQQLHAHIIISGLSHNTRLCNRLMNSYASCQIITESHKIFSLIEHKSLVSWTILINGFTKNGLFLEAIETFRQMVNCGLMPNAITISSILPAIGKLRLTLIGKSLHCYCVKQMYQYNVFVQSALVHMYSKLGCPIDARYVFDSMSESNVVSWNAIIFAYSSNGLVEEAIEVFNLMRRRLSVDTFTIMSLVSADFGVGDLQIVTQIHGLVVRLGHVNGQRVETRLIEMYIDVNCVDDAYYIFCDMPVKDVVVWTSMLTGFVKSGNWSMAVEHFNRMMATEELELDSVALIGILSGCSSSGALQQGRRVHALVIKFGFEGDTFLGSSIIDMYANCAKLGDARRFFEGMAEKDAACWNALIAGNGMHGYGNNAIDLFLKMKDLGIDPNESTLVSVLSACGHAGLVDQGLYIFDNMVARWNLFPNQKHYACVVDLLGRAGRLNDAYSVIRYMHLQPGLDVYGALLGACKAHGNIELGVEVSQRLLELKPRDAGYYILLSNIYAMSGNSEGVKSTRLLLRSKTLKKDPGLSSIEINGAVYTFMASEKDHPLYPEISRFLKDLIFRIQEEGYVPDLKSVYQDVADDLKKNILYHHSEKLAIAFGLMRTKPGTIIRVTKNLRACNDCHSSSKYISKVFGRTLVIKDKNRFHVFHGGNCSCGDYW